MAMQALVMGFGGTGAHILTALKELTVLKHGSKPDSVKFLLFDTIADWEPGGTVKLSGGAAEEKIAQAREKKNSLDPATEYFYLRDHDPDLKTHVYEFLKPTASHDRYPHLKDWLHAPWLKLHVREANLSIVEGAAQQRQIGRFAMFQNADRVKNKVAQLINELAQQARSTYVNVWVIGSSAGGTGAGGLLDAAYLTRLAVKGSGRDIQLTGVIVLPDVYNDKSGISKARAYSLFRELNRIQGLGIGQTGEEASMEFTSRVFYDSKRLMVSKREKGLFDRMFYLGHECNRDEQRDDFFASVASAIDPYLDENSGPVLLQEAVNETSPALSMGASRLYVPEETLADIFAWEQVETYLNRLAAPNEEREGILDIYSGSPSDREESANSKVKNLLALFGDLLDRADQRDDANRLYVQNTVTPEKIVTEWYQFGGGAIAGIQLSPSEKVAVQLTHVNPYISFTETDETKVPIADRVTKTYKENEKSKGLRESQEQSKARFAAQIDEISKKYTHAAGGERTFAKGLKQVLDIISAQLRGRVDRGIINELTQATYFVVDPDNPKQGTVLTRLRAEGQYAISALRKIDEMVAKFIATLNEEAAFREQQPVSALNQLTTSKSPGFFGIIGTWVETYQQSARDECYEYIRWYQKRELIKNMQQLVRSVIKRFEEWQAVFDGALNSLVLQQPDSSLFSVRERFLKKELAGRLSRLGQNQSARISWEPEPFDKLRPDVMMQGYREELKKCIYVSPETTLADEALAATRWEAVINKDGLPELRLAISLKTTFAYALQNLSDIHRNLHSYFRQRMNGSLEDRDIFDYLLYAQHKGVGPDKIAKLLNDAAQVLINAKGTEECRLVFRDPIVPEKQNLATAIRAALGNNPTLKVNDSETTHSDKNSITLLKIKKPNLDDIEDLRSCRDQYIVMQTEQLRNDNKHDDEVNRSQVYHAFRAELEAWFIERRYCVQRRVSADAYQIPPRIVRLLDDPAMMQAFVHCLATGAIERDKEHGWVWHDTVNDEDVTLVSFKDKPGADIVQAAITFVLLQREGLKDSQRRINLEDALQSAVDIAKSKGKTRDAMLIDFGRKLDKFLGDNLRAAQKGKSRSEVQTALDKQERQGLQIVLDFYADPETRTALQHRME
ncbi:MAG: tubulin-like doman-containing protein [Acidobacteria bacterium]|nr:tubulin-like doman-containing protein [Acidobacteriota bacterium]